MAQRFDERHNVDRTPNRKVREKESHQHQHINTTI